VARRPRFRTRAAANLLSQVEYAKPEVLRRMASNAERLARGIHANQLVSEAWLIESVTGVRSRDADASESLVGAAVIDDLAALAIRLTDRAPFAADRVEGGAFTLEQAARRLGVGVRTIQRWRRLGLLSMRFQFSRSRRVGCSGAAIAWFESTHAAVLARARRAAPSSRARPRLHAQAQRTAAAGGTLHAASRRLAVEADVSPQVARRALERAERQEGVRRLERREAWSAAQSRLAWRAWRRGADLRAISRRVGRSRAAVLRAIARHRRLEIAAAVPVVSPLATFERDDAAETILAPRSVREQLARGEWPDDPRRFLAAFPAVLQGPRAAPAVDQAQLPALRFLLWRAPRQLVHSTASSLWSDLDRCEASLRWAARLRISLVQRMLREALGRLQAMAWAPLETLPEPVQVRAIEIAVDAAAHVLDDAARTGPLERAPRLGSLAAARAEQQAAGSWNPRAVGASGAPRVPGGLAWRCVPWMRVAPLRDDLAALASAANSDRGCRLLSLRHGWSGEAPRTLEEAAAACSIHPRRAAIEAAEAQRQLRRALWSQRSREPGRAEKRD
jgi:hypothetical protein